MRSSPRWDAPRLKREFECCLSAVFTNPELAHVGMTESEARVQGVPYRVARMPMTMVLRTRTLSQTRGFMKALIGADDRILGFHADRDPLEAQVVELAVEFRGVAAP